MLVSLYSVSALKALVDCILYYYSFKIVNVFVRQLWPFPSAIQMVLRWLGYMLATLLFFVGKIMKEVVYHGIAEVLASIGFDEQKCAKVIRMTEDVEANFQIFSAYSFGFFVLAIYDHFGSI